MSYDLLLTTKNLKNSIKATVLFVITDNTKLIQDLVRDDELIRDLVVIIATPNYRTIDKAITKKNIKLKRIVDKPTHGLAQLSQIKDLLLEACMVGTVNINDRVLCIASNDLNNILYFDVKEIGIPAIREELGNKFAHPGVLEAILNLAYELAREGREGKRLGALFVIGDTDNVLKHVRQLVINPFEGHKQRERDVTNIENWETMKEFAHLDGAFIFNERGIALAAGCYLNVSPEITVQSGLGGRQLAAASITRQTKAIAITISASGIIRIFKNGNVIFKASVV